MPERPHVLFVNEAVHSHGTLQERLAAAARERPDMTAAFASVAPPGRFGALLVRRFDRLGTLDLQMLRWRLRWSREARRLVRQARPRPDAVFVNTQACGLALRGEMRSIPVALSVDATARQFAALGYWRSRDRFAPVGERPLDALERRAYGGAAVVVAWTEWSAESLRSDYGVPAERVVTLNPGVDAAVFRDIPGDERGRGPLRVLFVGNGVERKGLPQLIDAVRRARVDAVVDVVTSDPVPAAPGVHVHAGLAPGSAALLRLFGSADVLALPTRADAAPWVVLEAMAAGLPVVSSRVAAIPELVGDAGTLLQPGDVDGLAGALEQLGADPKLRAELGERGRQRVAENYDSARQLPALLDLLASLPEWRPR
jgi:glycosyltransferase involved in cell wall biosynthesis